MTTLPSGELSVNCSRNLLDAVTTPAILTVMMPEQLQRILNQMRSILTDVSSKGSIDSHSVPHLMVLSRELLEAREGKQKYPHLNFYSNWTVHTELSRSNMVIELLDSISEALSATSGPKWYNDAVLEVIGLQHLRRELIALYQDEGLSTDVFHGKSAWKVFVSILLESLLDKPIK
jgi:hypothetical protein